MQAVPSELIVPTDCAGQRLDVALAALLPMVSRSRISSWIKSGQVLFNGAVVRPRDAVQGGERVQLQLVPDVVVTHAPAQPIALDVLHDDEDILVINKPAGLVVHPGAGNPDGTLVNALLHRYPKLELLPRAGIVHRLDKETSGVMVIAKTMRAHTALVAQLAARQVKRHYLAVVNQALIAGGTVNAPIGRHLRDRLKMAVRDDGREAITHYRIHTRFRAHTALHCQLETGRTHQIRVHMAYCKHPIVGDPLYGGPLKLPRAATDGLVQALRHFKRQALHAQRLEFVHPASATTVHYQAGLPDDLNTLLAALHDDTQAAQS